MAKKKPAKKTKKTPKPVKRHTITPRERLEHMIKVSLAADTGHDSSVDQFFRQQAERLQKELKALGKK